jgi:ABC-2 type transport system ATP-binding protein
MQTQSDTALAITGLTKRYDAVTVLDALELSITRGAIHGLVGLNGSGKTTTIECLLGLQGFQAGSVTVLGHEPTQLYRTQGRVVAIFDTPSLHPGLTLRQNLELARLLCDKPVRSPAHVEKLLGIERYSRFRVSQLSLGNKRRASIAQALLGNPELIILDEPFNGLDAGGVDDVLQLIQHLNRDAGTSFFLCSHQLPYLEQVCSHIAILHKGRIATSGTITDLLGAASSLALVRTEQIDAARALIDAHPGLQARPLDANGYLPVDLGDVSSSELNALLVSNRIGVAELQMQRASLTGLFREINGGGDNV